jgi:hypothetical protein
MIDFIYDLESYPNLFCVTFKQAGEPRRWVFEISHRRNDIDALCAFIQWVVSIGGRLVGFNNVGFDYPVLHSILMRPDQATAWSINQTVSSIINKPHEDRFGHIIYDRDQIVPQLDLFKIHHFDNRAKFTSLKILEYNMRSESIQELPFPPGTVLTDEQIVVVIAYNGHDVNETEKFYWFSIDLIRFREELSAKYNRNFLNHNDTKIGKDYFIMRLEEAVPGACYDQSSGSRKPRQTRREYIALNEVVFPYIQFQQPGFTAMLNWFKSQRITRQQVEELNTEGELTVKGIFTKIPETDLGELAHYCQFEKNAVKGVRRVKTLNTVVNGFQFDFGSGGLHGSIEGQTVSSSDTHVIVDIDVSSYYPNLAIANNLYPLHLGELFPVIYKDVYGQRKAYKKGSAENAMLKLALNGVYGDSNNKYSVFFDTQYTMSITVNGQLLLCMLAEQLMNIPELQMIQANTDGLTVRIPRARHADVKVMCKWWEGFTHLELEEAIYDHMHIRDCNAYIGRYSDGKIKRKGPYRSVFNPPALDKGAGDLEWHQDHSALVIPMAVESVLIDGGTVRDFILNHDNIYDFTLRTKIPRSSRLVIGEVPQQNVCRYYVSRSGEPMVKIMPPLARKPHDERRIGICVGWLVSECNDINKAVGRDINFEYYIQEAEKLLKPLLGGLT